MLELLEQDVMEDDGRKSSKGNQFKWCKGANWYKLDYTGYEGLAEYTVSGILSFSNLEKAEYVPYHTEQMNYKDKLFLGCKSKNFLPDGWKLITLERLFQSMHGESLNKVLYAIHDVADRIEFLVSQTVRLTGLDDFGIYLSKLFTVDAFFLNEDRHTHNIAVLLDDVGVYHYCPIFDHGAALLSDTTLDYPLAGVTEEMMKEAEAKTVCKDFDEQLDAVEDLYGRHFKFCFDNKEAERILADEPYYPDEIKQRVQTIIRKQRQKYQYLFCK